MTAVRPKSGPRPVRAPRGTELSCKGWQQEAALRMLMNNLDPEVAEDPDHLIVYGGTGRAARSWEAFDAIVAELQRLENDETLLVASGKPVGVFRTTTDAPRVLIANANLVPHWATWEQFRELERAGLTMYGQMTAGSWIYIATQGIIQGTYETFGEVARQHFGGSLRGTVTLTAGLGGMGGAQPLAVTMNEGACLIIEVDEARARRRLEAGYVDELTHDLDEAIRAGGPMAQRRRGPQRRAHRERSGRRARARASRLAARHRHRPDLGPRSAGRICPGRNNDLTTRGPLRENDPDEYVRRAKASMADHVRAMLAFQAQGAVTFDYGNNIRAHARDAGVENAFDFPGFVPAFIRPLFCEGRGPFRVAALSGDPADIARIDAALAELFPHDEGLQRWLRLAAEKVPVQGLPARICWLGYGERAKAGAAINELVASGEISAPIVIGRDHLDAGSVASPYRETEAMRDGSDAIADWPILNALVNTAAGATWVSFHHGGGVGIGYSLHAGMVVVADGTPEAAARLERVLTSDPGMGVIRHADAGYERALEVADERGVRIPMRPAN